MAVPSSRTGSRPVVHLGLTDGAVVEFAFEGRRALALICALPLLSANAERGAPPAPTTPPAQTAPPNPTRDTPLHAHRAVPHEGTVAPRGTTTGQASGTLGDKLAEIRRRSVCPPPEVDPEMHAPTPQRRDHAGSFRRLEDQVGIRIVEAEIEIMRCPEEVTPHLWGILHYWLVSKCHRLTGVWLTSYKPLVHPRIFAGERVAR